MQQAWQILDLIEGYFDFEMGSMVQEDLAEVIVYYGWTYCFRDMMHLDDYRN